MTGMELISAIAAAFTGFPREWMGSLALLVAGIVIGWTLNEFGRRK